MSSIAAKTRQIKNNGRFGIAIRVPKDAIIDERGYIDLLLDGKIVDQCQYEIGRNVGVTYIDKEMPNVIAKMADYEGDDEAQIRWGLLLEEPYLNDLSLEEVVKRASYRIEHTEDQYVVVINSRFPYYEHVKDNVFKNHLGRLAFENQLVQCFINYATVNIVNPFFSQHEADEGGDDECDEIVSKNLCKCRIDTFFYICHQAMLAAKEELAK